eukprot:241209-Rhodomonas_salina.1
MKRIDARGALPVGKRLLEGARGRLGAAVDGALAVDPRERCRNRQRERHLHALPRRLLQPQPHRRPPPAPQLLHRELGVLVAQRRTIHLLQRVAHIDLPARFGAPPSDQPHDLDESARRDAEDQARAGVVLLREGAGRGGGRVVLAGPLRGGGLRGEGRDLGDAVALGELADDERLALEELPLLHHALVVPLHRVQELLLHRRRPHVRRRQLDLRRSSIRCVRQCGVRCWALEKKADSKKQEAAQRSQSGPIGCLITRSSLGEGRSTARSESMARMTCIMFCE